MSNNINKDAKEKLASKIEQVTGDNISLQNNPDLKTKGEHQQRRKCSECGKSYLGQENSSTCGDKCRQRKHRK